VLNATKGIEKSELSVMLPIVSIESTSCVKQLKLGYLYSETAKKLVAFFIVCSSYLNSYQ
jgi:hypothetical protein